jgi:hypothetical protein
MSNTDPFKIDMIEYDLKTNLGKKALVPLFGSIFDIQLKRNKYSLVNKNWNNRIHGQVISFDRTSPNSIFFEIHTKYVPPIPFYDYLVEKQRYNIEATYGTEKTNYEDFNEYGFVGSYENGDDESWETTPHNLKDDLIPPHLLVLYNVV